jgi:formamidopyrimidine-DNA glycosylase
VPELPEVETIARTLLPQVQDHCIRAVSVLCPRVLQTGASLLPQLAGGRVARVFRRGKLLLFSVDCAQNNGTLFLVFHLKMTGRFFMHPADSPGLKHTRMIIDMTDGGRLFFDDARTFGFCRVMRPEDMDNWPYWATLGPEPLDMDAGQLAARLTAVFRGRNTAVKAVLLDQKTVAGIGNIYADESLFQASIPPDARAGDVSKISELAEALQSILRKSIAECGSSIRDYRDALGNAGAFQNSFAVYGRKGQLCLRCGAPLQNARVAGRGTTFCGRCQK